MDNLVMATPEINEVSKTNAEDNFNANAAIGLFDDETQVAVVVSYAGGDYYLILDNSTISSFLLANALSGVALKEYDFRAYKKYLLFYQIAQQLVIHLKETLTNLQLLTIKNNWRNHPDNLDKLISRDWRLIKFSSVFIPQISIMVAKAADFDKIETDYIKYQFSHLPKALAYNIHHQISVADIQFTITSHEFAVGTLTIERIYRVVMLINGVELEIFISEDLLEYITRKTFNSKHILRSALRAAVQLFSYQVNAELGIACYLVSLTKIDTQTKKDIFVFNIKNRAIKGNVYIGYKYCERFKLIAREIRTIAGLFHVRSKIIPVPQPLAIVSDNLQLRFRLELGKCELTANELKQIAIGEIVFMQSFVNDKVSVDKPLGRLENSNILVDAGTGAVVATTVYHKLDDNNI